MSSTEKHRRRHAANVLGALALAVTDRMTAAMEGAAGQSSAAAAALSALDQFLDGASIDVLGRVLGLTSSGTVRLVDRLEVAGHVRRATAMDDARSTVVHLTAGGRRVARRIAAARLALVEEALATLTLKQLADLEGVLAPILTGLIRGPEATRWICRACDLAACGRDAGRCPVANEAARRYGREATAARAALVRRPRRRRPLDSRADGT